MPSTNAGSYYYSRLRSLKMTVVTKVRNADGFLARLDALH